MHTALPDYLSSARESLPLRTMLRRCIQPADRADPQMQSRFRLRD
jgi:hypothetical protein